MFYIFLDLFSNKPTKLLGTWCIGSLNNSKRIFIDNIPILDINSLILLKTTSFFEREKLDKELKDACDLYALVFYSEQNLELTELLKHALDKILNREDLCEFISEQVLRDSLKAGKSGISKVERRWYEYDRHRWRFKTLQEWIDWYNERLTTALDIEHYETPNEAFVRKLPNFKLFRLSSP